MATEVRRLLNGNDTLYGDDPREIAKLVESRLNALTEEGWQIKSIAALPDYHTFVDDGGNKDILFLIDDRQEDQTFRSKWNVMLLVNSRDTMSGQSTPEIMAALKKRIFAIQMSGQQVEFIVPLTDYHSTTVMIQGIGGEDGTKNILLCCRKK